MGTGLPPPQGEDAPEFLDEDGTDHHGRVGPLQYNASSRTFLLTLRLRRHLPGDAIYVRPADEPR